jgi:hypothetical protein
MIHPHFIVTDCLDHQAHFSHRGMTGSTLITAFAAARIKNGIDRTSVEGAANLPYAVPNMAVELSTSAGSVVARRGQFTYRLRDRSLH